MIKYFIKRFDNKRNALKKEFSKKHMEDYQQLVKVVIEAITDDEREEPDPDKIHIIDDGEYEGTIVFIIASKEQTPAKYWYVKISYGSCSFCDTLQTIHSLSNVNDPVPNKQQIKDYMTLALHIVQNLKEMI